jgi:hypothetical protein
MDRKPDNQKEINKNTISRVLQERTGKRLSFLVVFIIGQS